MGQTCRPGTPIIADSRILVTALAARPFGRELLTPKRDAGRPHRQGHVALLVDQVRDNGESEESVRESETLYANSSAQSDCGEKRA